MKVSEFGEVLHERLICVLGVSVTDSFDISTSKTIAALEPDDVVVVLGERKVSQALGVTRVECQLLPSKEKGWVTIKSNQGAVYLEVFSPYSSFVKTLDKQLQLMEKGLAKLASIVKQKAPGSLLHVEARPELSNLKPKVSAASKRVEDLKKRLEAAKKEFSKRDAKRKTSQQETQDKKKAEEVSKSIAGKVGIMEAHADELDKLVKPLLSDDLVSAACQEPLSLVAAVERLIETMSVDIATVKDCLNEHQSIIAKATMGPLHDAKQALAKVMFKVNAMEKKSASTLDTARAACAQIAKDWLPQVSAAFRELREKKRGDGRVPFLRNVNIR